MRIPVLEFRLPSVVAARPTFHRAASSQASPSTAHEVETWEGFIDWRTAGVDVRRFWGNRGPVEALEVDQHGSPPIDSDAAILASAGLLAEASHPSSLAECGLRVLLTPDPLQKAALTTHYWQAHVNGRLPATNTSSRGEELRLPDRPARPERPKVR